MEGYMNSFVIFAYISASIIEISTKRVMIIFRALNVTRLPRTRSTCLYSHPSAHPATPLAEHIFLLIWQILNICPFKILGFFPLGYLFQEVFQQQNLLPMPCEEDMDMGAPP